MSRRALGFPLGHRPTNASGTPRGSGTCARGPGRSGAHAASGYARRRSLRAPRQTPSAGGPRTKPRTTASSRARRTKPSTAARASANPRRWCRGARGRGGDVCQRRARLRTSTVRVTRVIRVVFSAFRSGGARPELSRGGFVIPEAGTQAGEVRRTHLTRTNWRTSSERASRSTPRSAAFASNAAHADSHRLPEFTSFTGAASSSSKPSSSRWRASETTGPTGATFPWCVRARLTAPSPRDSRPRLVPGIAPVWAACVAKCRALISSPSRKKKPKPRKPKSQTSF